MQKLKNVVLFATIMLLTSALVGATTFVRPAMAGFLTNVNLVPTNNLVNTVSSYDIIFTTATTATIRDIKIEIKPIPAIIMPGVILIEASGIGPGTLKQSNSNTWDYIVTSPQSIHSGTSIRLEIGNLVNPPPFKGQGTLEALVSTINPSGGFIDGGATNVYITKQPQSFIVTQQGTIQPGHLGGIDAFCPTGSFVTGGGYERTSVTHTNIISAASAGSNDWGVSATNVGNAPETITVQAYCLTIK
jgi:hypothetical protein